MKQTAVEFLIKAFQGAYGDKVIKCFNIVKDNRYKNDFLYSF